MQESAAHRGDVTVSHKTALSIFVAVAAVAAVVSPLTAAAQHAASAHEMHRRHGDSNAYIASLEDPNRAAYQKPDLVVTALELEPGQVVADIGAGSGYFAVRLADAVGPTGRVLAVDVDADLLAHLDARAREASLGQLTTVLAPPDDPQLPAAGVDLVFFSNVWHHIEDQAGYLEKVRRALKPAGRLVMIDFHKRDLPVGPDPRMKIAREDLVAQLEAAGWRLTREHDFLPYQYFLEFRPAAPPAVPRGR